MWGSVSAGGAGGSTAVWLYLHDNDESQLGSQNMPELHSVWVLLLMAGRVAVITIPAKKEYVKDLRFHADFSIDFDLRFNATFQSIVQRKIK